MKTFVRDVIRISLVGGLIFFVFSQPDDDTIFAPIATMVGKDIRLALFPYIYIMDFASILLLSFFVLFFVFYREISKDRVAEKPTYDRFFLRFADIFWFAGTAVILALSAAAVANSYATENLDYAERLASAIRDDYVIGMNRAREACETLIAPLPEHASDEADGAYHLRERFCSSAPWDGDAQLWSSTAESIDELCEGNAVDPYPRIRSYKIEEHHAPDLVQNKPLFSVALAIWSVCHVKEVLTDAEDERAAFRQMKDVNAPLDGLKSLFLYFRIYAMAVAFRLTRAVAELFAEWRSTHALRIRARREPA